LHKTLFMFNATSVTDKIITDKIDINYINSYFREKGGLENTSLLYVCKSRNLSGWRNQSWKQKGITYHMITLSYSEVSDMSHEAVRALMLDKAMERLSVNSANA
jgi:hypothetical protein